MDTHCYQLDSDSHPSPHNSTPLRAPSSLYTHSHTHQLTRESVLDRCRSAIRQRNQAGQEIDYEEVDALCTHTHTHQLTTHISVPTHTSIHIRTHSHTHTHTRTHTRTHTQVKNRLIGEFGSSLFSEVTPRGCGRLLACPYIHTRTWQTI